MGYACSWSSVWWILLKIAIFIILSFLFSVIFWATKKWLDNCKCGIKKKKK